MAALIETWNRHAQDLLVRNIPGVVADFTPEGMAKAMSAISRPLAADTFAVTPLAEDEVEVTFSGEEQRTIWMRWVETPSGQWKVADVEERNR